jgi:hypothetical protein
LRRGPWVISKLTLSVIPPRYYSSESLTLRQTPWLSLLFPRGPSLGLNSTREKEKGWRGLPAAREVRRGAGLAPGGPGGHNGVRLDDGDGWNHSVHVRRRVLSSAAGVPAKPRRPSPIQWYSELHGVT